MEAIGKTEYTKQLAKFCSQVKFDELPQEVIDKAKLCVLDYVANVYGSLELGAVSQVVKIGRAHV